VDRLGMVWQGNVVQWVVLGDIVKDMDGLAVEGVMT
jgi:hypothetical protein